MKKLVLFAVSALILAGLNSCNTDTNEVQSANGLSQEILDDIRALGFGTDGAFATDGGYIVEGDIFLTEEDLHGHQQVDRKHLIIANEEQYRTFNLVTGLPRTITVSVTGNVPNAFSTSVDNALARYNAENLGITFQRVGSGGNINIRIVNTGQYIASAGFPSNGNPYNTINYAKKYTTGYSDGFMTTVLAHEIGHCIGFRHTDYMNRAYSCGSGGNEGQETTGVGAVLIPGTPTGPDAGSWMLACLGATTNRPFNSNDVVALNYLY